jgi:hypothetical protein
MVLSPTRCFSLSVFIALALAAQPALAEARIVKGPYLMDARADRVAVMFELSEPAAATVVVLQGEEELRRLESPPSDFHEVLLSNLEPQSSYDYRVEIEGATAIGSITTAPPNGEGRIRFLVMGDNRTDAQAHAAVIARMREHPADFVINTGDMVSNGADAEDWQELFDVERELLLDTPVFPVLGNHELYRHGVGLPSFLRYTRVPDSLDSEETYYGFDWGPVRFLMLDSNDDWSDPDGAQRAWLVAQLEDAAGTDTVAHVMLAVHHGPVSSNAHGSHPDMLSTGMVHLLRRHGVGLVLSGHDHAYERGDAHGVKYIVTGGGGAPIYDENDPLPFQHRFDASHHFLLVEATHERVDVTARRVDDSVIERCGFERGGRWLCERPDGQVEPSEPVAPEADAGTTRVRTLPLVVGAIFVVGVGAVLLARWRSRRGTGSGGRGGP